MKRFVVQVIFCLLLVFVLAACAAPDQISPTLTLPFSATPLPATNTPLPTRTPISSTATETPLPTDTSTPKPTSTKTSQPTATDLPYEIITNLSYVEGDSSEQSISIYLPTTTKHNLTLLISGEKYNPSMLRYFAELGYPTIGYNARGDTFQEEIQDSFCALAWAHANADNNGYDAIGIIPVGGSMWGGNAALLGLVDDPALYLEECPYTLPETDRVRAVIALAGVFDYSGEEDFFAGFIESIGSFMGGTPDQVPDNWAAASAITWVKGNEPPFLLVHGEADTNVTAHQSEKFAAALETVGSEAELVLLPGIDHYNSVTDRKVFEAMQSFLEQLETTDTSNTAADTDSSFEGVRVTFISTAGFLITVGDQRILIDAIYQGYPGGVLKPILEGQPPFDGVDLILATHEHLDHFDPELVLQYLQNNPETEFASTQNAVEAILALDSSMRTRLTTIDLNVGEQEQRAVADINLEAMYLSHGMPGIQNLGYILTIDDITIFHTGDMDPSSVSISDLQDYGLPEKQLDIAFIPEFLFVIEEFHAHILEGIPAEYLIPMHFGYEPLPPEIDNIFPNMIIFRETYENWELPK